MADSTLNVNWTSCNTAISRELGMSTDPSTWTDSSVASKLDYVRQSAERSFYYALLPDNQGQVEWGFLNPPATLNLVAGQSSYDLDASFGYVGAIGPRLVYAAGTGYVSAEKVDAHTLTEAQARESGSTLSASITSSQTSLVVASTKNFPVNLVPFTILIESEQMQVTAVSGTTFTVNRGTPGSGNGFHSTTQASHASALSVTLLGPPKRFAVRPKASTPTSGAGQRFELLVFPTPDVNATVSYRYNVIPDAMTSANPYPYGGAIHGETLMLACLARAELLVKGEPGPKTAEFKQQLGASITMDRRSRATESEQFPMAPALLGSWGWVAQEVGRKLDLGANPALWSWSDLEKVRVAIQRGVIEVLKPADTGNKRHKGHRWSWLNTLTTVTTSEPYSTGTVTIASGVVTLAAGTFPSWAGDGTVVVSGVMYDVSTRDSDTQVTLADTSATASAGSSYVLGRYRYTLGGTFAALSHDHLTFSPGIGYPTIKVIDPDTLREQQQSGAQYSYPWFASVRTKTPATTGTTRELVFWPIPNTTFLVTYKTKRSPLEYSDGDYLPGGTDHANLWVSAALAQIDKSNYPQFIAELGASIELDQLDQQTHNLGTNRDHSDDQNIHQLHRHWRIQSGSLFGGNYPS